MTTHELMDIPTCEANKSLLEPAGEGVSECCWKSEWKKKVNDKEQKADKKNNFVVLSSDYNKMIKDKILRFNEK